MEKLNEFFGSLASKLKSGIGLKPNDLAELRGWAARCDQSLRDNQDRWEGMKQEIGRIELRIRKKKQEMDASHGMVRQMVGEEIEGLFSQLDRKANQIRLMRRNSDLLEISLDKIREVEHASAKPMSELQIDLLTTRLEEAFEELSSQDGAFEGLKGTLYAAPDRAKPDVQARLSELEPGGAVPARGLSSRTADRLKQLEQDLGATPE